MRLVVTFALVAACGSTHQDHNSAPLAARAHAGSGATSDVISGVGDGCQSDADCTVTNFAGCCTCPQCSVGDPTPRNREALAAEEECTDASCSPDLDRRCAVAGMCLPGEDAAHFRAVCHRSECAMVRIAASSP